MYGYITLTSNKGYIFESRNNYFHFDTSLGNNLLLFYDPFLVLYFSDLSLRGLDISTFVNFINKVVYPYLVSSLMYMG